MVIYPGKEVFSYPRSTDLSLRCNLADWWDERAYMSNGNFHVLKRNEALLLLCRPLNVRETDGRGSYWGHYVSSVSAPGTAGVGERPPRSWVGIKHGRLQPDSFVIRFEPCTHVPFASFRDNNIPSSCPTVRNAANPFTLVSSIHIFKREKSRHFRIFVHALLPVLLFGRFRISCSGAICRRDSTARWQLRD